MPVITRSQFHEILEGIESGTVTEISANEAWDLLRLSQEHRTALSGVALSIVNAAVEKTAPAGFTFTVQQYQGRYRVLTRQIGSQSSLDLEE